MKKSFSSFRKRYGDRAKEVMYATATKMAKEEKDHEVSMAQSQLSNVEKDVKTLKKKIGKKEKNLPAWMQAKITDTEHNMDAAAGYTKEEFEIEEGMTLKDFKANRRKLKRREASADAKKRGHVGKEWYNSGRTYSPDEAKSGRANMQDHERSTRKRSAMDPEGDDDNYSADKTKNPKKLRKQKAMGEAYVLKPFSSFLKEGSAWTRKEGQNSKGGLNEKGRKSYEAENPGSDLKAPSKEVGNSRRASFCARMKGMKSKLTSKKTASDPDSRINKSLRAWNC
ncbi:hypothetical protein SWPG_00018 [Synechococcus phage S-CBM2]|nr:hypothetical protein SWPG_00018 [Synechococcus phage S-CBM2]